MKSQFFCHEKKCNRNYFLITQHVVLDPFVFKQISQVVLSIFIKEGFISKKSNHEQKFVMISI